MKGDLPKPLMSTKNERMLNEIVVNRILSHLGLLRMLNENATRTIHCTRLPATKAIATLTKMAIIICSALSPLHSCAMVSEGSL